MSTQSRIEWTETTWNPVIGCTRKSLGCDHCYAVRHTQRLAGKLPIYQGLVNPGKRHFNGTVRTLPDRLGEPLRWRRPRRVFVNSMSDLFHEAVHDDFIDRVFAVMALCRQHTFQVLTKRPERMAEWCARTSSGAQREHVVYESLVGRDRYRWPGWPLPNVWLGTSVENQAAADERVPHLLRTPAAVRFLSCEPLLGPVDLTDLVIDDGRPGEWHANALHCDVDPVDDEPFRGATIDWVIAGGESGPSARPMHPEWPRMLRDQCQAAGVAFFFKQWGAWISARGLLAPGQRPDAYVSIDPDFADSMADGMMRVGKRAAGRELDGRTWDEYPASPSTHDAEAPMNP